MLDALPVSGEGKLSSHPAYRGQASPHLSSLTLRMQFHPSERCVEPRSLTCSLPHGALCPCPSNVMCWQRWSLAAPHTHVHTQACTHTRTGAVLCPASLRLCSGGFLPQDRLSLGTQGLDCVLTACADPSRGLSASWLPRFANTFPLPEWG